MAGWARNLCDCREMLQPALHHHTPAWWTRLATGPRNACSWELAPVALPQSSLKVPLERVVRNVKVAMSRKDFIWTASPRKILRGGVQRYEPVAWPSLLHLEPMSARCSSRKAGMSLHRICRAIEFVVVGKAHVTGPCRSLDPCLRSQTSPATFWHIF
jgi:hypothetical protein